MIINLNEEDESLASVFDGCYQKAVEENKTEEAQTKKSPKKLEGLEALGAKLQPDVEVRGRSDSLKNYINTIKVRPRTPARGEEI